MIISQCRSGILANRVITLHFSGWSISDFQAVDGSKIELVPIFMPLCFSKKCIAIQFAAESVSISKAAISTNAIKLNGQYFILHS